MRSVPIHYIRANEGARIPSRHVAIDTEARSEFDGASELQTWRCGAAAFLHRTNRGIWHRQDLLYEDPAALWSDVADFTRPNRRTVVWAHNLSYDLRVSQALVALPRLGFDLVDIRLSGQGTWARFASGPRSLVMADSWSVWPVSLETLGATIGLGKPPLPAGDDLAEWFARCGADVAILAEILPRYLDWLRAADMGSWQLTGAGQAWSHWRHRHYTHRVLVGDDEALLARERRAMWTGRAEAYRWGADPTAVTYEYDYSNAYARLAGEREIPVRLWSVTRARRFDWVLTLARKYAVLAEVNVDTPEPVAPTEHAGRIVWPVGRFDTILWDPELQLLADAGATVRVGKVWIYRKAPALADWSSWVLAALHAGDEAVPAWQKLVIKHWSRALIGRFAMRYRQWEPFADAPSEDLRVSDGWDTAADEPFTMLQVGHRVMTASGETDADNAAPMVTGYITSAARAKLWRAVQLVGAEHVLYVDTDSLLVDRAGHDAIRAHAGDPVLAGLRLKRRWRGYDIAGPRQLELEGRPRIAGVPRSSRRLERRLWEGEVWRGLAESIRRGEADRVRVTTRQFHIGHVDNRRVRLAGGRTRPVTLPAESQQRDAG